MKQDKLTMSLLFDCYGDLLTQKQRECFELYCNQDLTLAEIAELMGTSRQGVHDAVSRAEIQLLRLEEVTRCLARSRRDRRLADRLEQLAAELPTQSGTQVSETAAALRSAARMLKE